MVEVISRVFELAVTKTESSLFSVIGSDLDWIPGAFLPKRGVNFSLGPQETDKSLNRFFSKQTF